MGHVFISYSRTRNKELAEHVTDVLKKEDVNVWFDQQRVIAGQSWADAEEEALDNAVAMLVVLNNTNYSSASINFEAKYAIKKNIPIIVLSKQGSKFPSYLSEQPMIMLDADNWVDEVIHKLPKEAVDHAAINKQANENPAKGYLFISYSIEDLPFISKLRQFLAEKDYAYWDYQETHREYDIPFHLEIENAIRKSKGVISIVSPDWKASKWATREFLFSEQMGKVNFVCIVHDVGPTLLYADKTFIEFFKDEEKGFDILDKALRREGLID